MSLSIVSLVAMVAAATATPPPRTVPYRITDEAPPVIDGLLADPVWQKTVLIDDFHQIQPTDGGMPSERTEVRIAYNAENIYVALRAYDKEVAGLVSKGMIQGQPFFSDDRFEVRLDTFNDRRNAYFFQINANGIRREALVGNDYFIEEWDTVWHAEARVHDWGWSAEIAIPLKSIAFDPSSSTWGLNLSRVYPRRGEEMSWASRERSLTPAVSGYADGLRGLDQGLGLELVPSLTANYHNSAGATVGLDLEPAFTGFYNLTPFLTAGVTLNTDFSATEIDERRINLTRFSLFFPEKREFFLRDASIFEFANLDINGRPFFSRRIGLAADGTPLDVEAGAKLSGRAGKWNLGALLIRQEPGMPSADDVLFVGRATRNVFEESEVGVIATHGDPLTANGNRLFGADFTYRSSDFLGDRRLQANFWAQRSATEGLSGDESAFGARFDYPNDQISGFVDWRRLEDNFNPALGFVNRRGVDQFNSQWRYRHRLDSSFWQWVGARVQLFRSERIGGELQSEALFLNLVEGISSGNDFFTIFVGRETEGLTEAFTITDGITVQPGEYGGERYGFFIETGPQREIALTLEYVDGDFLDGEAQLVAPAVEWRPNRHVLASVVLEQNRVRLAAGRFTSRLLRARLNIAFSPAWAWLNLIQGDNLSDTLSINSRLQFEPHSARRYFLVLNHSRNRQTDRSIDTSVTLQAVMNFRL